YLVGDQSNQEPPLPGYGTFDLRTLWRIARGAELFAQVENVLDAHYYAYGAFTGLDGLPPNLDLTNPRTYSPAPGRVFYAGVRIETD
ncbi:MAG: hypothetical protein ACREHV_04590, partial [Rhizomicrobium sp.]